jgi:hypothetical protein
LDLCPGQERKRYPWRWSRYQAREAHEALHGHRTLRAWSENKDLRPLPREGKNASGVRFEIIELGEKPKKDQLKASVTIFLEPAIDIKQSLTSPRRAPNSYGFSTLLNLVKVKGVFGDGPWTLVAET